MASDESPYSVFGKFYQYQKTGINILNHDVIYSTVNLQPVFYINIIEIIHILEGESMDAVTLARIQFAFSVGFHYLFPTMTFGLTLLVLIFETMYVKTANEKFKNISNYVKQIT